MLYTMTERNNRFFSAAFFGNNRGGKMVSFLLIVLIPVAFLIVGIVLFLSSPSPSQLSHFEIGRFSGTAEIYDRSNRAWQTVTRRTHSELTLGPKDKLKTGMNSDLDLKIPGTLNLRLKPSSEMEILKPKRGDQALRLKMLKGSVIGIFDQNSEGPSIQIDAPAVDITI